MENLHSGHRKRIRENYRKAGIEGLQEHEILELLLTYAIPRKDVNEHAHRLLRAFGNLQGVLEASIPELMTVEGIGEQAAVFLRLLHDVNQRVTVQSFQNEQSAICMRNTVQSCRYALAVSKNDTEETLRAYCLDKHMRLLHMEILAVGEKDRVAVSPNQVVKLAILHGAAYVVLSHNHPSGDLRPSESDLRSADRIREALNAVGVNLSDELILGHRAAYSFRSGSVIRFLSKDLFESYDPEEYQDLMKRLEKAQLLEA